MARTAFVGWPRAWFARRGGAVVGVGELRVADERGRSRCRRRRSYGGDAVRDGGALYRRACGTGGVRRGSTHVRRRVSLCRWDIRGALRGRQHGRAGAARCCLAYGADCLVRRRACSGGSLCSGGRTPVALGNRTCGRLRGSAARRSRRLECRAFALRRAPRVDRDHRGRRVARCDRVRCPQQRSWRRRDHRCAARPCRVGVVLARLLRLRIKRRASSARGPTRRGACGVRP